MFELVPTIIGVVGAKIDGGRKKNRSGRHVKARGSWKRARCTYKAGQKGNCAVGEVWNGYRVDQALMGGN